MDIKYALWGVEAMGGGCYLRYKMRRQRSTRCGVRERCHRLKGATKNYVTIVGGFNKRCFFNVVVHKKVPYIRGLFIHMVKRIAFLNVNCF